MVWSTSLSLSSACVLPCAIALAPAACGGASSRDRSGGAGGASDHQAIGTAPVSGGAGRDDSRRGDAGAGDTGGGDAGAGDAGQDVHYEARGFAENPRDGYYLGLSADGSFRFAYLYYPADGDDASVRLSGSYEMSETQVVLSPAEVEQTFSSNARHGAGSRGTWAYTGGPIPLERNGDDLVVPPLQRYEYSLRYRRAVTLKRKPQPVTR